MGKAGRLNWIDYARGICIILVVAMHFHGVLFIHLAVPEAAKSFSDVLSSAARPARMPTFFFISGFLASGALNRPWRQIFDGRVGLLYWTYLLWSIIATFTLFALYEPATIENVHRFASKITLQAVYPRQSTWFLYGLVVFFIAARLLRRWSLLFVVVALGASAFSEEIADLATSEMVRTLPFFLIGVYSPWLFHNAAGEPSVKRCSVLAAAYVAAIVPLLYNRDIPGIWLPATGVGITLLLSVSRLLDGSWGSKVMRYIGRNTLPIYVIHMNLLLVARETGRDALSVGFAGAALVWVIGLASLIALCLGLAWLFKRGGLGWLFAQPGLLKFGLPSAPYSASWPLTLKSDPQDKPGVYTVLPK